MQDVAGNLLTVTPAGITSSNGLSVPFVRDTQGRITQITDPLGNKYQYGYDANGNLTSVTYPQIATPAQYKYGPTLLHRRHGPARQCAAGYDLRFSGPSANGHGCAGSEDQLLV